MWRRECGLGWEPSYPHLFPLHGHAMERVDPRLGKYFPKSGFIFGTYLGLVDDYQVPPIDMIELKPIESACSACFAQAVLSCDQCLQPFCHNCWQHQSVRSQCSAHPFCSGVAEYYCPNRHPICEYHIENECQVCSGRIAAEHCSEHSYTTLNTLCQCGRCSQELCLNCNTSCCSQCKHTCDRPQLLDCSAPTLDHWQSFAVLYPFSCDQFFQDASDTEQRCAHFQRVVEFIDFTLVKFVQEALIHDVLGFTIETVGPFGSLESWIASDWLEETFYNAEDFGVARCHLLSNTDRKSPQFGQIAMVCLWFNGVSSLHIVAREPKDLLRQMHSAYCEQEYFPVWFLRQHLPILVGQLK